MDCSLSCRMYAGSSDARTDPVGPGWILGLETPFPSPAVFCDSGLGPNLEVEAEAGTNVGDARCASLIERKLSTEVGMLHSTTAVDSELTVHTIVKGGSGGLSFPLDLIWPGRTICECCLPRGDPFK
eukprot:1176523-Prorocentrum_minimum.AAC.2